LVGAGPHAASAIPVYQYQASLDVPIFTGGRIEAERAKAEITLRQLKQQEQAARDSIALEVKTSIAQLVAARNEVDVANLGVIWRGRKWTRRATVPGRGCQQYRSVTAQNELARANDNQIAALYRYNRHEPTWRTPPGRWRRFTPSRHINPWIIAFTVMLATFMECWTQRGERGAAAHRRQLSASTDEATWVLTSYLVANAIILPMGGWFSMLMGRKRFYMICVALFTISSFLCAWRRRWLADFLSRAARHRRGALQPMSQAILVETFRAKSRAWRWRCSAWAWCWRR